MVNEMTEEVMEKHVEKIKEHLKKHLVLVHGVEIGVGYGAILTLLSIICEQLDIPEDGYKNIILTFQNKLEKEKC